MMKFSIWLESRQFKKLIPPEVLALVAPLKAKAKELTKAFWEDKSSVPGYTHFAKIKDTFYPNNEVDIAFLTQEEWDKRKYPQGQGVAGKIPPRVVHYKIPMTGYDTIYHELVHAFDPKFVLFKTAPGNNTPHEVDAYIGGHIDVMKEKLRTATPQDKKELIGWLRHGQDTEPYDMPKLLAGMNVFHLKQNPKVWRKFVSSVYNEL